MTPLAQLIVDTQASGTAAEIVSFLTDRTLGPPLVNKQRQLIGDIVNRLPSLGVPAAESAALAEDWGVALSGKYPGLVTQWRSAGVNWSDPLLQAALLTPGSDAHTALESINPGDAALLASCGVLPRSHSEIAELDHADVTEQAVTDALAEITFHDAIETKARDGWNAYAAARDAGEIPVGTSWATVRDTYWPI